MHYIIGTQLLVPETVEKVQTGPVDITSLNTNNKRRVTNVTPFKTNVVYTLFNIKPHEDGLQYSFSSDFETVVLVFDCTRSADTFIASIRNEAIPNYDAMRRESF